MWFTQVTACARKGSGFGREMSAQVKRFLRSPTLITVEVAALALVATVGAALPQAGSASSAELVRWYGNGSGIGHFAQILALDRIFRSAWFLVPLLMATASLGIVVLEQFRRLPACWSRRLTPAHFRNAPYRTEFERSARPKGADGPDGPRVEIIAGSRFGLLSSPVFHLGLLLVIPGAAIRALFAVDAAVDLMEGETLPPSADSWNVQWPRARATPLRLEHPTRLERVVVRRYDGGALQDLTATLSLPGDVGMSRREIGINRRLRVPGCNLFLGSDFGPAALIEWQRAGAPPARDAVLLTRTSTEGYTASCSGPGKAVAHLRAPLVRGKERATHVDVRLMDDRALLFAGAMRVGDSPALGNGISVSLRGLPYWVRLHGTRDPSQWLTYSGFALVLLGTFGMFAVVKVDTCVMVTAAGDREHVVVALRAQRFVPLYEERFRQLVRKQGGGT